jgi:hypothetical protein
MEYEKVTQKMSLGNAVLAALMSGRKYDVIPQNGDSSRESHGNADDNLESPCVSQSRTGFSQIFCNDYETFTTGNMYITCRGQVFYLIKCTLGDNTTKLHGWVYTH